MLVDDDELFRESMAATLTNRGFRVSKYESGLSAFTALSRGEVPDLIVLDLVMPEMDGWEFRRRQLDHEELASIPVIALSGDRSAKASAIHAAAFISKPLVAPTLLDTIEHVLRVRPRAYRRTRKRSGSRRSQRTIALANHSTSARSKRRLPSPDLAAERREGLQLRLVSQGLSHLVNNALQGLMSFTQSAVEDSELEGPLCRAVFASALHCADVLRTFADCTRAHDDAPGAAGVLGAAEPTLIDAWHRLCPGHVLLRASDLHLLRGARVCQSSLLGLTEELIRNAVEALGERAGSVHIRVSHQVRHAADLARALPVQNRRSALWCCLEVRDDGPGIPAPALTLIWMPFYSTRFAGRGLGLATVVAKMRALGGLVEAESLEGQGTAIRLLFPTGSRAEASD